MAQVLLIGMNVNNIVVQVIMPLHRKPTCLILTSGLALITVVSAETFAQAETVQAEVSFSHSEKAFPDFNWDTGYLPEGENIQVRFTSSAWAGLEVQLPAEAQLERGEQHHQLVFRGKADQGTFKMGLETTFKAYLRLDQEIEGYHLKYEGALPLPGGLDALNQSFVDQAKFTPLGLDGAEELPINVALSSPRKHLVTIDTPIQFDYSFISVKVRVPVDIQVTLKCKFKGKQIETVPNDGSGPLLQTQENQPLQWLNNRQLRQEAQAHYVGERELALEISLFPRIQVVGKIDLQVTEKSETWDVAEFKIAKEVLSATAAWDFPPQPIIFNFNESAPTSDGDPPAQAIDPDALQSGTPAPSLTTDGGEPRVAANPDALLLEGGCALAQGSPELRCVFLMMLIGLVWRRREV